MVNNNWHRVILMTLVSLIGLMTFASTVSALEQKIFDEAGLLSESEKSQLETFAGEVSEQHATDVIIVTTNDAGGRTAERYMADFYDEKIAEQGLSKWNAVILAIDMGQRDLYLGSFYKGKTYLGHQRIETILDRITPLITAERYEEAFQTLLSQADRYLDGEPANILMQWWFQIVVGLVIGGLVVGSLVYSSGGRVTINSQTYMDTANSRVLNQRDRYIRTTVTKVRKPKSSSGGGGGGGGRTGGGHSYSGGGRSF